MKRLKLKNPFERIAQKGTIVMLLCVVLTGSFYSCEKKAEAGSEVPFKPCPCEVERSGLAQFHGEAYLFKDSIPLEFQRSSEDDIIIWYSEIDQVTFFRQFHGNICNFPDFAKEWAILQNGCKVYLKGIMYPTCRGGIASYTFDLVLTSLIKK